jgi:hypothetical protein
VIQVVTGGADGTVAVWLVASRNLTRMQVIEPLHGQPVTAVALYMPDANRRHDDQSGTLQSDLLQSSAKDVSAARPNAWLAVAYASGAVHILARDTRKDGLWYTASILDAGTGECRSLDVGFEGVDWFLIRTCLI